MKYQSSKEIFVCKIRKYLNNFGITSAHENFNNQTLEKFYMLYNELTEWNKKINITAITDENGFIKKHIIDSAFLLKILDKKIKTIMDIGSGAGFPGVVLNIMYPALNVVSIESVYKKCNFQKNISRKLNLSNFNCINMNIFSFNFDDNLDAITTRAAFNANELINLIEKLDFKKNIDLYLFLSNLKEAEEIGHFKYRTKFIQLDRILFYKTEYSFRLIAKYTAAPK